MNLLAKILQSALTLIGLFSIVFWLSYAMTSHHRCKSASEDWAHTHLRGIGQQVELFRKDKGRYPISLEELIGDYLSSLPQDPWGNEYQLRVEENKIILFTYDIDKSNGNYSYSIEYGI